MKKPDRVVPNQGYRRHDQDRDQGSDQSIFDRRGAVRIGGETSHNRSRSMGISGKSAAGIG